MTRSHLNYEVVVDFNPETRTVTLHLDDEGYRYALGNSDGGPRGAVISGRELKRAIETTTDNNYKS